MLIERELLSNLPDEAWLSPENRAYAVRRFDRPAKGERLHMEDFAQVRNMYGYGVRKYEGNYESLAALIFRGQDYASLREFCRRLTFNVLVGNEDAHWKNWSLLYRDPRKPVLSPAYDLVSTISYDLNPDPSMALKFFGSQAFGSVTLRSFDRLESKLGADGADLRHTVVELVQRLQDAWSSSRGILDEDRELQAKVTASIDLGAGTLNAHY